MNCQMVKLGDVCTVVSGSTPKSNVAEYWDGDIKWITPAEIDESSFIITDSVRHLTKQGVRSAGLHSFPAGTVILSSRAPIGKTAIAGCEMYCNQGFKNLVCSKHINNEYLYFYLSGITERLNILGRGATFKELSKEIVENIEIPLPLIEEQVKIARKFKKIRELSCLYQKQKSAIDSLAASRFIEMFGDPLSKNHRWPCMVITDACRAILGGGTPSKSHPEYFAGMIPWISPKDMKSTSINDSIDHITEAAVKHSTTNLVPVNSVLMVIRSGILKHTLPVAINNVAVTINQDMKAFVPNGNIRATFLLNYFKAIESDVLSKVRGVTADNIDFKAFQKRIIMVPPLILQDQFAAFVAQSDKFKIFC